MGSPEGNTQITEDIEFHFMDKGQVQDHDWISTLTAQRGYFIQGYKEVNVSP